MGISVSASQQRKALLRCILAAEGMFVMKGPLLHLLEYLTLLRHQFFLHVSSYLPSHALPSINELFALKEERMLKDMALTTKAFVSNKLTFEALLRSLQVDKQD